jgi:DNA-binding response OmpR family regulator
MERLIFVVDSHPECCELIHRCLESSSFTVHTFPELDPDTAECGAPSVIIFGLHPENQLALTHKAPGRSVFGGVPWLVITDSGSQENRRRAFSFGADDWICKPFSASDLVRRVEQLLQRTSRSSDFAAGSAADLLIDNWAMRVCVRGNEITTTTLEFRLMEYLARHRGQVFTRDFLLDAVWGNMRFVNPRSVDACIARIREKIELDRNKPTMLKTVRGVGYRLDAITAWQSAPSESCGCPVCTTRTEALRMDAQGVMRRKVSAETSST